MPAIPALVLALLVALASPAAAWERTAPPDAEGPPWGDDRFQRIALRIGAQFSLPLAGESGGDAAGFAPSYPSGWLSAPGFFGGADVFFCPGHAVSIGLETFDFPAASSITDAGVTYSFGPLQGVAAFLGWTVQLPVTLETELWTCTLAPAAIGPVLYGRLGIGAARLAALELDATPPQPPGDANWWDEAYVPYGHLALGFEYRFFRAAALFLEAAGGAVLPSAGSDWSGAEDAGPLVWASLRLGVTILLF